MEKTSFDLRCVLALLAAFAAVAAPGAAPATVWDIYNVPDLDYALSNLGTGDELALNPGTYNLDRVVALNLQGVSIYGTSGNRDDVILVGGGMNVNGGVREGITIGADNVSVSALTLKDFFHNALHLRAENDISGATISNVKTWNIGQRHVKGSWDGNVNHTLDNTLIEKMYMLQTEPRQDNDPSGGDYIGGMDIMSTNNIIIRDCVAEGIRGFTGEGNASIFLWQGHNNFLIERNVIIDTNKGIGIGLCYWAGNNISGGWHGDGGMIRNNFILRGDGYGGNNIGMELCHVKNTQVVNNTIYSPDADYFRTLSLWDSTSYPNTNLEIVNNLIRGGCWYNTDASPAVDATVAGMGNLVDGDGTVVLPEWFVDVAAGNLHLTELAAAAIDAAAILPAVPYDIDGGTRGSLFDFGADEFASPMGDANYDGVVDGDDHLIWADHYDQAGDWVQGDFTSNGWVDGGDYTRWADNYGYGAQAAAPVPAPAVLGLLAIGWPLLVRRRR